MVRGARRFNVQKRLKKMIKHYKSADARSALGGKEPAPRDLFGLKDGEDLKEMVSFHTAKGTVKIKLQETYDGMKVVGETVVVEKDTHGQYTGEVIGKLVEGIGEDLGHNPPKITEKEAFQRALQYMHHDLQCAEEDSLTANLEIHIIERSATEVTPVMVYNLFYEFYGGNRLSLPTFAIDAHTGEVYKQYEGLPDCFGHT